MRGLLLLLSFVTIALSDVIYFDWNGLYSESGSFDWSDTTIWVGGVAPGPSDDVQIIGGDYQNNIKIINLPSSSFSVNSLYYTGADVTLYFPDDITLTTTNLTIANTGCNITAATSATIVMSAVCNVDLLGAADVALTNIIFNISAAASWATTSTDTTMDNVVINNHGTFNVPVYDELYAIGDTNNPLTFNNYNKVTVVLDPEYDGGDAVLTLSGLINNWGSITIASGLTLQIGALYSSTNTYTYFYNWGSVVNNGFLWFAQYANSTLNPGSSLTGKGQIQLWNQCEALSWLIINYDFNYTGMFSMVGCGEVLTTGAKMNLTKLDWNGGAFTGSGPITVYNLTHSGATSLQATGDNLLNGRNMTITGYWDISFTQGVMYLGGNAYFICAPGSHNFYDELTQFEQWDKDYAGSKVGFVDYSSATAAQFVFGSILFFIPIYTYGTIYYQPNWSGETGLTGTGTPCAFQALGGGVFGANLSAVVTAELGGYGADSTNWVSGFYTNGGFQILSTAHFFGGLTYFEGYCEDADWAEVGCWNVDMYTWQGRAAGTTVGNGIITLSTDAIFNIAGPNVVFEQFWALDGQIFGDYNLTVQSGLWEPDSDNPNPRFAVNGTNLVITNYFNWTDSEILLYNGAKVIIEKQATLYVFEGGIADGEPSDTTKGFYNYGTTNLVSEDQDHDYLFQVDYYSYGPFHINSIFTTTDEPRGDTVDFTYTWENHNTMYMKVYSATEYDDITINQDGCKFMGNYDLNFGYTPKAYDTYLIVTAPEVPCSGLFNLTSSNLPSGFALRVLYDQIPGDGEEATFHYAVVCPTSNSTCMNMARDPKNIIGSTTSTTSSSTSSPSSSSSSSGTTHASSSGTSQSSSGTTNEGSSTQSPTSGNSTATTQSDNSSASSLFLSSIMIISFSLFFIALL